MTTAAWCGQALPLEGSGYAVVIKREAEYEQVAVKDLHKQIRHFVVDHVLAAVFLAGQASAAIFDVL